ncbi:hypothetical protein H8467_003632 [Salmonella enterica]|nr:hypothetical protein [Salmonella enterica subsp. enterica serovar Berta]EGC1081535.1 hypothetical protein [Salmonella enterica]HCM1846726.1 hypothetical protein [Salmonella enterica subsp. diarizonae serovar 16:z10:e,n,x,z15]
MSHRNKKNKQKSGAVTADAITAVIRALEHHTDAPDDALMVLAAKAHMLMASLDIDCIESRSTDGHGMTLTRTDEEENRWQTGR